MFALLPNKNKVTYNRLFREVRNAVIRQGNEPTDTLIDFERAAVNAATNQMPHTAQKMKFSMKDFFSKCHQIRRKLRKKLKKFFMENFIFCAMTSTGIES